MSNAQRLYLQQRIEVKLSRDTVNLRKSVGHLSLLKRLQPLLNDMDQDFLEDPHAIKRASREGTAWLAVERHAILKTFETRLQVLFSMRFDIDRFAELTRRDGLPHTLPQVKLLNVFKQCDTIIEE